MTIEDIIFYILVAIGCSGIILYIIGEIKDVEEGRGIKAIGFLMVGLAFFPSFIMLWWNS